MEKEYFLNDAIKDLAKVQLSCDTTKDHSENAELLDLYCYLRGKILEHFGLPNTIEFGRCLAVEELPNDKDVEVIIERLHQEAVDFFSAPIKTETEVLKEAVINKRNSEEVLSELGITRHIYTEFVYDEILLKEKDNPANVLRALQRANDSKLLNLLGIIALCKKFGKEEKEMFGILLEKGIKYLDQYLSAYKLDGKDEEVKQNLLAEFWIDLTGGYEFKNLDEKFSALTHSLMNYLCLVVGNNAYRIVEAEIYYHDKKNHPDPYVHCAKEQLFAGNWYFNGAGIDIAFGDFEKDIHAGILIRGIKNIKENRYISGPSNVLKEVFSSLGNITDGNKGICLREVKPDVFEEMEAVQTQRIGLTKKKEDAENYKEKAYRYIVEVNINHKFKDKETVVKEMFQKNLINKGDIKDILGYNIKIE